MSLRSPGLLTRESLLLAPTSSTRLPRFDRALWLVFICSLAVLLAVGCRVVGTIGMTGDEPWYVLQAYALWHHHTLNLATVTRDHFIYSGLPTQPHNDHTHDYIGNGEAVAAYLPGYAAIIAPLFALGGRLLVVVFQAIVAALTAVLIFDEARRLYPARHVAVFAVVAYAAALPTLLYAGELFPTTLATFLTFLGYVLITRRLRTSTGRTLRYVSAGTGLVVFLLPWLHAKYLLIALTLTALALVVLRPRLRRTQLSGDRRQAWYAAAFILGSLVCALALIAVYSHHYFGTWYPQYHDGSKLDWIGPSFVPVQRVYSTMFFDAQSGLLPWVPLDLLVPVGLALLFRRSSRRAWLVCACLVGLLGTFLSAFIATYVDQAYALPARFTVECAPFFAVLVAGAFAAGERQVSALFAAFRSPWRLLGRWSRLFTSGERAHSRLLYGRLSAAFLALALLAISGWFASVAQLDPALLYPSPAGVPLAAEFPWALPGQWFTLFLTPSLTATKSAIIPFALDKSFGQPVPGGPQLTGFRASPALPAHGGEVARTQWMHMPQGSYVATFTLACDPTSVTTAALDLVAYRDGDTNPAHRSGTPLPASACQGATQQIQAHVPFTSDGYHGVAFAVRSARPPTTVVAWWVTYAPASDNP